MLKVQDTKERVDEAVDIAQRLMLNAGKFSIHGSVHHSGRNSRLRNNNSINSQRPDTN